MTPTYQSGFYAPGRGVPKYPELWKGCVGAWNPGLGNSGLVLRDWSGNGNNGVLTNGPTWGVSGGRQALNFDGTNDYVNIGDKSSLGFVGTSSQFTLSAWLNFISATLGGVIFSKGRDSNFNHGWILQCFYSVGQMYLNFGTAGGSAALRTIAVASINQIAGEWIHLAVTFDGRKTPSSSMLFFVNGINQPETYSETATTEITANALTVKIGARDSTASPGTPATVFNGSIIDQRIYNTALHPSAIRTLSTRPGIANELAPRKSYFLPPSPSSQFYDVLSPSIFAGSI